MPEGIFLTLKRSFSGNNAFVNSNIPESDRGLSTLALLVDIQADSLNANPQFESINADIDFVQFNK